ncbi:MULTISPECIES: molybdopterin-guanine dinucleotide biosynthesis protein B [Campylobacter]|uniref:molybdopterin-guanine dinucleotide biosynthesis protein B n=1 Tax=Campylobacter TaxID=194 RepID=UPI0023F584BC|nr:MULTISPECIES: molybdopterin-guanine dinucleotide biosynthesis protein B [Campylobacter]MCI6642294.1 molybdopterin-guanine dinucleotide biosynthesis protein B [Campylobacter sp.]MDD7422399.1 molybdopterin-guanine dinucleotide biosynthesis protein B [Campylobacter hominis]MDY3117377.1 molybdopterin-guanine dinucleotide biosynthesis protein B [Campylobacter hominis]
MKRLAVAFSGPSNSGKTTLIRKVAKNFIDLGYKVVIIKHDPKDKASFDVEGKDSFKFSEIGADVVVMSPKRTTYFRKEYMELSSVISMIAEFDYLLVEGLKTLPLPRISVFRDKIDESYLPFSNAIATDLNGDFGIKNFDINDYSGICEWINKNAKKV